jgi:hypothetical protein
MSKLNLLEVATQLLAASVMAEATLTAAPDVNSASTDSTPEDLVKFSVDLAEMLIAEVDSRDAYSVTALGDARRGPAKPTPAVIPVEPDLRDE